MKKQNKDSLIIGFALFAMFFGAGNLIFPSYLGNILGDKYIIGILGFILTGVGLPLLAILACTKGDGSFESMASKISPSFAIALATVIFIALGPLLGIPRTAATTYELAIQPLFPWITPIVASIIYFAINLIFVLRKSSIIDTIGKFLTPILLILLVVIIGKGIFNPIGEITPTGAEAVFSSSVIEGYQTMDGIGALIFASIVIGSITQKGYKGKEVGRVTLKAGMVAVVGLTFVYGGLMYLGAQTTNLVSADIGKTGLLLFISKSVLGEAGPILIGLAMGVACLTTSVGLLTAGATFFEKVSKGKISYKLNAIIISIISVIVGSFGVDNIVKFSGPILSMLYPISITLIFITLLNKYISNIKAIKLALATAFVFGVVGEISSVNLSFIPLSDKGFTWLVPTVLLLVLGLIIFRKGSNDNLEIA